MHKRVVMPFLGIVALILASMVGPRSTAFAVSCSADRPEGCNNKYCDAPPGGEEGMCWPAVGGPSSHCWDECGGCGWESCESEVN